MIIHKDKVGVNLSPAQRALMKDPAHTQHVQELLIDTDSPGRAFVAIDRLDVVISRLQSLKANVAIDPAYQERQPLKVVEQLLLKLYDAKSAHKRAYPNTPPPSIVSIG